MTPDVFHLYQNSKLAISSLYFFSAMTAQLVIPPFHNCTRELPRNLHKNNFKPHLYYREKVYHPHYKKTNGILYATNVTTDMFHLYHNSKLTNSSLISPTKNMTAQQIIPPFT